MAEVQHDVAAPGPRVPETVLRAAGELEVTQEELRVAEAALAEQREQMKRLLDRHEDTRRWQDQVFAALPIGVLVTDGEGKILQANASAADLLGVHAVRLRGKPLQVYVETIDRRQVRDLLTRAAGGDDDLRAAVRLTPRSGYPLPADLIALPDGEAHPLTVRWTVLPRTAAPSAAAPSAADPSLAYPAPEPGDGYDDDSLQLAAALAQLCGLPADTADRQRMLGRIALVIAAAVPGATTVSITIGDPVAPDRLASDSSHAQVLDGMQLRAGEGPCVDAFRQGAVVLTGDVTADARWPRLGAAARAQPLRSVLALPIRVGQERTGVLNTYASRTGAFGQQSIRVGEVVAEAVAAVLRDASEHEALQGLVHHLERALSSRALIEQAKGIVMAHHGGTADEAFARLVAFSSRRNVKLRELAEQIVREPATVPLVDP
jgi:PAS domain S-box-containing protein